MVFAKKQLFRASLLENADRPEFPNAMILFTTESNTPNGSEIPPSSSQGVPPQMEMATFPINVLLIMRAGGLPLPSPVAVIQMPPPSHGFLTKLSPRVQVNPLVAALFRMKLLWMIAEPAEIPPPPPPPSAVGSAAAM